jgi:uncharacterized protein YodC (DUF2158 family)
MWKQALIGCGSMFALATAASAQGSVITASVAAAEAPTAVFLVPGDVVGLRSGGPKMTVERIAGNGFVYCVWFNKDERADASFPLYDLVVYTHYTDAVVLGQK